MGLPILLNWRPQQNQFLSAPLLSNPRSAFIQKAILNPSFSIRINNELFKRNCFNPIYKKYYTDWVEFYPTGGIKHIEFSKGDLYGSPECRDFHGFNSLEFNLDGKIISKKSIEDLPAITSF